MRLVTVNVTETPIKEMPDQTKDPAPDQQRPRPLVREHGDGPLVSGRGVDLVSSKGYREVADAFDVAQLKYLAATLSQL
jgi:hypothetical protein